MKASQAPGRYKVVETMIVTDNQLERIINETVSEGWLFDGIQFVTTEASKRPAMAFLLFTRERQERGGDDPAR